MARVRMEIPQDGGTSDLHCPPTTKLLVSSAPTGEPPTSLRISAAPTSPPPRLPLLPVGRWCTLPERRVRTPGGSLRRVTSEQAGRGGHL